MPPPGPDQHPETQSAVLFSARRENVENNLPMPAGADDERVHLLSYRTKGILNLKCLATAIVRPVHGGEAAKNRYNNEYIAGFFGSNKS